jgi:hypothetical protein
MEMMDIELDDLITDDLEHDLELDLDDYTYFDIECDLLLIDELLSA